MIEKVVLFPGTESTKISPLCQSTIDLTTDKPRPLPPVSLFREDSSL